MLLSKVFPTNWLSDKHVLLILYANNDANV